MSLLTCVGYLETSGGPACIAPLSAAVRWNGVDGDYWRLMEDSRILTKKYFHFEDVIIFSLRFGNILIFRGTGTFAVAEIVGGELIPNETDAILEMQIDTEAIVPGRRLDVLSGFGGRIAVFDSTLDGGAIGDHTGIRAVHPFEGQTPNTAVVEISPSSWEVSETSHKTTCGDLDIILFRSKVSVSRHPRISRN